MAPGHWAHRGRWIFVVTFVTLIIVRSGRHQECMNWCQWQALLQDRKKAWDIAEAKSDKTGNSYKNRHGEMVQTAPKDMIGVVLRRFCAETGLDYC